MRRRMRVADPVVQERNERIERLRKSFAIPKRNWLCVPGRFAADGRTLVFGGFETDRTNLVSQLIELEAEGEDVPQAIVFVPNKRRSSPLGALSPSLRGGWTLRVEGDDIVVFQLVAFIGCMGDEYLMTDDGELVTVRRDMVAAWDGTPIPAEDHERSEHLVANLNGYRLQYPLAFD